LRDVVESYIMLKTLVVFTFAKNICNITGGPIYKISYDLSQDYRKFIVRSTYDSDLQRAEISLRNIAS